MDRLAYKYSKNLKLRSPEKSTTPPVSRPPPIKPKSRNLKSMSEIKPKIDSQNRRIESSPSSPTFGNYSLLSNLDSMEYISPREEPTTSFVERLGDLQGGVNNVFNFGKNSKTKKSEIDEPNLRQNDIKRIVDIDRGSFIIQRIQERLNKQLKIEAFNSLNYQSSKQEDSLQQQGSDNITINGPPINSESAVELCFKLQNVIPLETALLKVDFRVKEVSKTRFFWNLRIISFLHMYLSPSTQKANIEQYIAPRYSRKGSIQRNRSILTMLVQEGILTQKSAKFVVNYLKGQRSRAPSKTYTTTSSPTLPSRVGGSERGTTKIDKNPERAQDSRLAGVLLSLSISQIFRKSRKRQAGDLLSKTKSNWMEVVRNERLYNVLDSIFDNSFKQQGLKVIREKFKRSLKIENGFRIVCRVFREEILRREIAFYTRLFKLSTFRLLKSRNYRSGVFILGMVSTQKMKALKRDAILLISGRKGAKSNSRTRIRGQLLHQSTKLKHLKPKNIQNKFQNLYYSQPQPQQQQVSNDNNIPQQQFEESFYSQQTPPPTEHKTLEGRSQTFEQSPSFLQSNHITDSVKNPFISKTKIKVFEDQASLKTKKAKESTNHHHHHHHIHVCKCDTPHKPSSSSSFCLKPQQCTSGQLSLRKRIALTNPQLVLNPILDHKVLARTHEAFGRVENSSLIASLKKIRDRSSSRPSNSSRALKYTTSSGKNTDIRKNREREILRDPRVKRVINKNLTFSNRHHQREPYSQYRNSGSSLGAKWSSPERRINNFEGRSSQEEVNLIQRAKMRLMATNLRRNAIFERPKTPKMETNIRRFKPATTTTTSATTITVKREVKDRPSFPEESRSTDLLLPNYQKMGTSSASLIGWYKSSLSSSRNGGVRFFNEKNGNGSTERVKKRSQRCPVHSDRKDKGKIGTRGIGGRSTSSKCRQRLLNNNTEAILLFQKKKRKKKKNSEISKKYPIPRSKITKRSTSAKSPRNLNYLLI